MENCDYNLEHFIDLLIKDPRNKPYVINENWCNLPRFSHDITEALITLHNQGIHLNGNINPSTVLIQQRGNKTVPTVILPERQRYNIFNNKSLHSIEGGETLDERERDLISFCLLIYFIQTCGHKFEKNFNQNYDKVLKSRGKLQRDLEIEKRCCAAKSSPELKYRMWKNSLAGHLIAYVLEHLGEISTSKLLRHPFYWNNWEILNFISKAASYVHDVRPHPSVKKELESEKVDFSTELKSYKKIAMYMETTFSPTDSSPETKKLKKYCQLLKGIRNKVRVQCSNEQFTQWASWFNEKDIPETVRLTINQQKKIVYLTALIDILI